MSNYYKSSINLTTPSLNTIIGAITNSSVANAFSSSGTAVAIKYNSTYVAKFNTINEKPNSIGYKYQGTDISTWAIAPYVESDGSTTFSSVPSWCTKIRAVLLGSGGGGGAGGAYNNYSVNHGPNAHGPHTKGPNAHGPHNHPHPWQGNDSKPDYNQDSKPDYNLDSKADGVSQSQYGGGGGGGGFVYLSSYDITAGSANVSVAIGTGGDSGANGGDTVLNLPGSHYVKAGGGNSGTKGADGGGTAAGTSGAGGTNSSSFTISNIPSSISTDGSSGSTSSVGATYPADTIVKTYTSDSTVITRGVGGGGGTGGQVSKGNPAGNKGADGYYRIYFLTG